VKKKGENKLNINANPAGALEIQEFKNRMAHFRKRITFKRHQKKDLS